MVYYLEIGVAEKKMRSIRRFTFKCSIIEKRNIVCTKMLKLNGISMLFDTVNVN